MENRRWNFEVSPIGFSILRPTRLQSILGLLVSILLLLMPFQSIIPTELSLLEASAVVAYAWSVWLLAKNNLLGWWIGLVWM